MKYLYEDLSDKQFERLIIFLCHHLLGIAVQGFSTGPDGGRDAKFVGTSELHPSKAAPWIGTTIIQAKHTIGYNRSFSESDFYSSSSKNTILGNEIKRIKNLRENNQLDHYMLFSNRKLSSIAENEIRSYISRECSIPEESIYLCGVEQLEIWLKKFPDVPTSADLDPVDSPLITSPDDLATVIQALSRQQKTISAILNDPPKPRVSYEQKNILNKMTKEYALAQRKNYLKDTKYISSFLAAPENYDYLQLYNSIINEFQLKIIAYRNDYPTFDKVMEYLIELLCSRDPILRQNRHLTRAVLFYMYWNCDIGKDNDAETY